MSFLTSISRNISLVRRSRKPSSSPVNNVLWSLLRTLVLRAKDVPTLHRLTSRGLLQVEGRDTVDFLQGLVTSDVSLLSGNVTSQFSMMLNAQGRVMYDLLLYRDMASEMDLPQILVECDINRVDDLLKLMSLYKIRKKVRICPVTEKWDIFALIGGFKSGCSEAMLDPRVPTFGCRILRPSDQQDMNQVVNSCQKQTEAAYHELRYQWGIPEGPLDLPPGNCLPLESNLLLHNGVSFEKGCYLGQELTARTHHSGVTRKRLMPLEFDIDVEATINPGTSINRDDGKKVGTYRNRAGKYGLGLVRIADVKGQLTIADKNGTVIPVNVRKPNWWPESLLNL